MGWHGLIKLYRFQVYSSTIPHLYIVMRVHHPKSSLLPSPFIPPLPTAASSQTPQTRQDSHIPGGTQGSSWDLHPSPPPFCSFLSMEQWVVFLGLEVYEKITDMGQIPIKTITLYGQDHSIFGCFIKHTIWTQWNCSVWSLSWSTQLAAGLTPLLEQVDEPGFQREADSPLCQVCLHTQPLRPVLDETVQVRGLLACPFTECGLCTRGSGTAQHLVTSADLSVLP